MTGAAVGEVAGLDTAAGRLPLGLAGLVAGASFAGKETAAGRSPLGFAGVVAGASFSRMGEFAGIETGVEGVALEAAGVASDVSVIGGALV